MNDGDALYAAIRAQPDDDILRLVYADWLDENGQPARAAFVRAQVQAARAEPFSQDARRSDDTARKLLEANRGAWTKHLGQHVLRCEFRRGFVDHAQVNVASLPRHAAELFVAEPIRSLHLVRFASPTETVSLIPVFETPQLEHVARLDFAGLYLSPVELDPLIECPFLDNLTDLGIRNLPVMPNWIERLIESAVMPSLVGLDLADLSHLTLALADALPAVEHRRFVRLDVSRIPFTSAQLRGVLESPCLQELEELRLGWRRGAGHDGALSHLNVGWAIPWDRLRVLDLNGQGVGDEGVQEIVKELTRRKEPTPLRWLGLAHNHIGSEAVRALVRSDPAKVRLNYLDVTENGLSLSQVAALQSRFPDAVVENRVIKY